LFQASPTSFLGIHPRSTHFVPYTAACHPSQRYRVTSAPSVCSTEHTCGPTLQTDHIRPSSLFCCGSHSVEHSSCRIQRPDSQRCLLPTAFKDSSVRTTASAPQCLARARFVYDYALYKFTFIIIIIITAAASSTTQQPSLCDARVPCTKARLHDDVSAVQRVLGAESAMHNFSVLPPFILDIIQVENTPPKSISPHKFSVPKCRRCLQYSKKSPRCLSSQNGPTIECRGGSHAFPCPL